jgi:DNA replication protein DnaC
MNIELQTRLKKLKLSGAAASLSIRNSEAIHNQLSYIEFLELIIEDEYTVRNDRRIQQNIKKAKFRELKTLETFDFTFNPCINKKEIFDFAVGHFIRSFKNILFLGPSGVGKSHLAQAIGLAAVKSGFSVIYRSAFDIATDMAESALSGTRKETIMSFSKPNLFIIDDFGLKTLPASASEDFLEILMRRYETNSTILTANRPIEDFGKVLQDSTAAMAILDRFLHHAHIIKIKGKSFRMSNREKII